MGRSHGQCAACQVNGIATGERMQHPQTFGAFAVAVGDAAIQIAQQVFIEAWQSAVVTELQPAVALAAIGNSTAISVPAPLNIGGNAWAAVAQRQRCALSALERATHHAERPVTIHRKPRSL